MSESMQRAISVALIHYPVLDRSGGVITSAITNLDLHDIARSAYTYGLSRFYVVHPVSAQRQLADKIRDHWTKGSGARRIPDRAPAMACLRVVPSLDAVLDELGNGCVQWSTSARSDPHHQSISYPEARLALGTPGPQVLLLLGTAWGLAEDVHRAARFQLPPICSLRADGYNHLSVRAALAITVDRLLGERC